MADFSDKVKQYGSVSAALAASGYSKGSDGAWSKSSSSSSKSKSSGGLNVAKGTKSSGTTVSAPSTNYHQDAIDAAARGDWDAVNTALNNRQNKIDAQGGNDRGVSNSQILADLQKQYGGSSSSGSSTDLVKGPGYVTGGYTNGVYGTPILGDNPYWKNPTMKGGGTLFQRGGPDMSRRPDLAGQMAVSNGYTIQYDEDGYARKATKGAIDYLPHKDINASNGTYNTGGAWTDIEMMGDKPGSDYYKIQDIRAALQRGEINGDQANAAANAIRSKYGYTIDKQGNVYDSGVGASVAARRNQLGISTPVTDAQKRYLQMMFPEQDGEDNSALLSSMSALNQGKYNPQKFYGGEQTQLPEAGGYGFSGYGSFEDFLAETGYDQYAAETQAAIRAAVQNAINGYRDQIDATNDDTAELARQAYIAKMLGQKNLDQQLSANGYAGGMADSQRIATETNYQNQLNELEKQRLATVKELESAITNAQLTGDMQTAQELSSYLQQIQGQWVNYVQNQQQMAQQDYWNRMQMENDNYWKQQSMNAQNQENAYSRALNLLNAGFMPDDETLTAAGISRNEAQNFVNQLNGQTVQQAVQQAVRKATGGGYNNGSLTTSQVKQLQQALGVTADGLWGSNSSAAAGGMTADEAWNWMNGNGTAYNVVLSDIQELVKRNESRATINNVIVAALNSGRITNAQAAELRSGYVGSSR